MLLKPVQQPKLMPRQNPVVNKFQNLSVERKNFVTTVMNDLDKKIEQIAQIQKNGQNNHQDKEGMHNTPMQGIGSREGSADGSMQGTRIGAKNKNLQANFKGIGRDQYFNVHIKNPSMVPPIGAYKTRFDHLDAKVGVPLYGTHATWGGELKKQAKIIRDRDFKAKVKPCSRLDRTLVYVRNNVFESLRSQAK